MEQRNVASWRAELPRLCDLFSFSDAPRFGLAAPATELAIRRFIDLSRQHRAAGVGFSYVITLGSQHAVVGCRAARVH